MEWTYEHDVMFCKEVRLMQPFKAKKGSPERGRIWNLIAESLNQIDKPKFKVNKRSVRERFNLLGEKYKTEIRRKHLVFAQKSLSLICYWNKYTTYRHG